jgi:formate hydrogenlyase subunit 3/multisubunit Na+/H+ antiporter MnhD subunit
MALPLLAVGLLMASAVAALLAARSPRWSTRMGTLGAVAAGVVGLAATLPVLAGAPARSLRVAWQVPHGAFFVAVDALSALFLLPVFAVGALTAVYGGEYLRGEGGGRSLGPPWFFFNLLLASMAMVIMARNAVLFLMAWEVMAVTSFFLVTFDDEEPSACRAGWTYLVAAHLGTACLLVLFVMLGRGSGSLDFDRFAPATESAGLLFLLALAGFGTKAGLLPFHVWLPEAHPAAPSHVSALMSGVMIKTGIYGLLRTLPALGTPHPWWGWVLCAVGLASGLYGVLFALAQSDLKKLLAYSSVENAGIVAMGLGLGVLGLAVGLPVLAVLGFAGALLHVVNHSLFKSLLFLAAGAVVRATGTREIDRLGGLLKRMPWTAAAFLVAAAAICGLPPLNGFVGEFVVYLGALQGITSTRGAATLPMLAVLGGLALVGGLAAACFTKAFGMVFLGEPRGADAASAHEAPRSMLAPMLALAAACVLAGAAAPQVTSALAPVLAQVTGLTAAEVGAALSTVIAPLSFVALLGLALIVLVALLAGLRRALLARRVVSAAPTWDCGYAAPSPRMQYTGSSFTQPLADLFAPLLRTRVHVVPPDGAFPRAASLATETPDLCGDRMYGPAFAGIESALAAFRWLQHGGVHLYVLYIALTLVALLVWKLG